MSPRTAALLVAAAAVGGCVLPPDEDPVQIKLNDIDGRMQRIERVVANQSLVDLDQRMQQLQADLRAMRGRVEELENELAGLRKQQRDLYADLDKRLSAGAAMSPRADGGFGAAGVPGSAGAAGRGAPSSASEQAAYDAAFAQLKGGNYPGAIAGFRQFLAVYPSSALIDNANYWLGEAYYVTRDYPSALAAFQDVLTRSPDSRKAPDALLKLGFTQQEMKRTREARATLTEVTQRYPETEAAKLAAERLRRLPATAR
ncbi:MAG TPA: tol-pal system protein YbgF [Steroidobacteraceae bacterium]|nr:tol-pal system protein YbgF [Steroidobacteraceae bacterium]